MDLSLLKRLGIQHSCYPNSILTADNKIIPIIAKKEELPVTVDYSTIVNEEMIIRKCTCGFNGCRKIIKNYNSLPEIIRRKYENSGSVVPESLLQLIKNK